ncbi:MAG: hypothetical protein K2N87_03590 [Eubacterium sp.]|nr:hypothetical protein [Eubacterium sp.]
MEKKKLIPLLCLLLISAPVNTFADSRLTNIQTKNHYIQPFINRTGYKYKAENGIIWKRLWSYTYNRWEDSEWTPL